MNDAYNKQQATQCTRLVAAVLMKAIHDYDELARNKNRGYPISLSEPAQWILSENDAPYSFLWCCSVLDLAPHRLKNKVGMARILPDGGTRIKVISEGIE